MTTGQISETAPAGTFEGPADVVASVVALAGLFGALFLVGWLVTSVQFATARLPSAAAASLLGAAQLFAAGLRSTILAGAFFFVTCVAAYLTAGRNWDVHRKAWHAIVHRGVTRAREDPTGTADAEAAPLDDRAVRLLAGFNILILSALVGLGFARIVESLFPSAWWAFVLTWIAFFLAARFALTKISPLLVHPRLHGLIWVIVAVGALFASAPVGVLLLTGVAIATAGRRVVRHQRPGSGLAFLRSPLPWLLLVILALVGMSYEAIPPVTFARAVVTTTAGMDKTGGYLTRNNDGVYLVTCNPLADATSTNERVELVTAKDVRTVSLGGPTDTLDSGDRPSLISLALDALGVGGHVPTYFNAGLRPRYGTCLGAPPTGLTGAVEYPALGAGVIVGPAPPGGQAHDGEPPVQTTTPAPIAQLARRYQPSVLVTVADRNWPVSVGALLAERGANGQPTCLHQQRPPTLVCRPTASNLAPGGAQPGDYLQFPVHLTHDGSPAGQFRPFENGQFITTGSRHDWGVNPGLINPWYTAQVYFYYAGPISSAMWPATPPDPRISGLVALEYWFYYPYNYFPTVTRAELMNDAPIAGDDLNVDLHQGDWEHIAVLLDPHTLAPKWLYMARHSSEGEFVPWESPSLGLDHGHPLVQAAYGGHPTYQTGCGAKLRPITDNLLADWLVCGSGRFAFRAASTPLVDIAATPWACWPGHFGEAATGVEVNNAGKPENVLDSVRHQVFVAGPLSPLKQAEIQKLGVCRGDPRAPEQVALRRYFSAKGGPHGGK